MWSATMKNPVQPREFPGSVFPRREGGGASGTEAPEPVMSKEVTGPISALTQSRGACLNGRVWVWVEF